MKIWLVLVLALAAVVRATEYTPPYVIDWTTAGVPGGIPTGQTTNATISSTNDTTDRATAIQAALDACPSGQKVVLGAGMFYFGTQLTVPTGVILSGSGVASTIVYPTMASGPAIYAGTSANGRAPGPPSGSAVTSSVVAGTTSLTIADTAAYTVGQLVRFSCSNQNNNAAIIAGAVPVVMITGFYNSRIHIAKVTAKTGTVLTIAPGLFWDSTGLSPVTQPMTGCSSGVGVQNLEISCIHGTVGYGIQFESCQASWVYDVKITQAPSYGIFLTNDFQVTVDHCYMNQAGTGGSNGAGILFGSNGDGANSCLIQNNILYKCIPSVEVNYGSCGNVFAYNYCYDTTYITTVSASLDSNHGPHNSFNLYEGNIAPNIQCDGFFGSTSEDTVFRNWFTSTSPGATNRSPVLLNRFTRRYALVGNLLGTNGQSADTYTFGLPNLGNTSFSGTAQPTANDFWADWNLTGTLTTRTNNTDGVVTATSSVGSFTTGANLAALTWSGGLERLITVSGITSLDIAFNGGTGTNLPATSTAMNLWPGVVDSFQEKDLDVQASTTLKGNYNTEDDAIPAGESLAGQTLANSLYLTGKPSWFGPLAWPAFDSSAPNFSQVAIPAGYRYTYGRDPGDPSAGISGTASLSGNASLK